MNEPPKALEENKFDDIDNRFLVVVEALVSQSTVRRLMGLLKDGRKHISKAAEKRVGDYESSEIIFFVFIGEGGGVI